ncbi:porin [Massilia sp. YIM B02443]|uniref:porin n=1 Tax=Massilia sp. YIM B02443 TaxID=3050127 RepID=UPI0025B648BE|nr:porin [Massilia sp. YIM B02443]MDN4037617.1 porin [Massilia sp. YIM B02443]
MNAAKLACAWLALAIAPAIAQDTITMYGVVDMALVREAGGKNGSLTKLTSGVPMGSRIGIMGSEQLGNGLKAVFVLENGFQADTGEVGQGGLLFGRQAYVGLQGRFGSVLVGRQYTPHYQAVVIADPFGSGYVADSKNLFATSGNAFSRMDNTVKYITPTMAGASVELAVAPGESNAGRAGGRQLGAAVDVRRGRLRMRFGYHARTEDGAPGHAADTGRNTVLAAVYDVGVARVHGAYGRNRGPNSAVLRHTANPYGQPQPATASTDSADAMLGILLPFGQHALMLSVIRKDDRGALDQDARQTAVGYRYALSQRTELYAVHAHIDNRHGAAYTVGNASEGGSGDRATSLGMRHAF